MSDDLVKRLRALVIIDEVRSDNRLGQEAADRIEALEEALKDTLASLVAATSLLRGGGRKAAWSDKVFQQMLADYEVSADRARALFDKPQPSVKP